jgi:hypothetical protein
MARLDRAIHEKASALSMLMDGWVKPGHDSGGCRQFFHTLEGGNDAVRPIGSRRNKPVPELFIGRIFASPGLGWMARLGV